MVRWCAADNTHLHSLHKEGKANPNNINFKTIEAVRASNFPQIPYKNFSTLFCNKVRLWNLEQTLAGKRKFPTVATASKSYAFVIQCVLAFKNLMTDTTYHITGDLAVPSHTLVDVTPAKKFVANKHPTNSNHDSSLDDKSYNSKSDFKTDKAQEEEDKVDKQSSEKEEEEEVSSLIEDLREINLETTLAPMRPIMYD
jgi:hypothetical protein